MAFTGIGTKFQRKESGQYEDIANVNSINGPGTTRDTVDTTTFDSTGGYREFITGLRDGGSVSLEMNFSKDAYDDLLTDFNNDAVQSYEIFFAKQGAGAIQFDGLLTDQPVTIPMNDKVTISATFKVSGAIVVPDNGPYVVDYDPNGADSGAVPDEQTKEHGVDLTLRANSGTLELSGSTFNGWNTSADGSGTRYDAEGTFALDEATTLYAEWI